MAAQCHYKILGIEKQANESEIKKAFRQKALEFHPDRQHHRTPELMLRTGSPKVL